MYSIMFKSGLYGGHGRITVTPFARKNFSAVLVLAPRPCGEAPSCWKMRFFDSN